MIPFNILGWLTSHNSVLLFYNKRFAKYSPPSNNIIPFNTSYNDLETLYIHFPLPGLCAIAIHFTCANVINLSIHCYYFCFPKSIILKSFLIIKKFFYIYIYHFYHPLFLWFLSCIILPVEIPLTFLVVQVCWLWIPSVFVCLEKLFFFSFFFWKAIFELSASYFLKTFLRGFDRFFSPHFKDFAPWSCVSLFLTFIFFHSLLLNM